VTGALLVPLDAIQQDNGAGAYLYVISQDVLARRAVGLGARNDEFVVVREGVREGELVALGDPSVLVEGRKVTVRVLP
jgi:multidrug efflux pump subunit AcrA (membrane-fusion protein)